MSPVDRIRKYLGTILFITGLGIVLGSVYSFFQWRVFQSRMLSEYDRISEEEHAFDDPEIKDMEPEQKNIIPDAVASATIPKEAWLERYSPPPPKEPFHRDGYSSGMMVIEIPRIKVLAAVIDGTSQGHLKKGPGLYEISPLPDKEGGNVCIAGHRTTYGAWFRHVDELKEGDQIILEFDEVKYIYEVERVFVVAKDDWSVTKPVGYKAVTLTACHPPGSARERIVVRAKLQETQ